ncbi:acyl-CoA ligase (AMP-forming), exosortase A system-associated [Sandaracinobacter sp. RS1-74]|uniref:acyl-CoA ligase (AMP-forming), exosortase A system-associated n=1 Tax=Sandaracinobacteroides sayramensis TaxID=2913411 RepID=UPI001EDA6C1B|nr:acyl-CoA ligase (AMP-forming), exosortase A system-associated [Sandaracinobacteroides sayramensis]MCG2842486.1 acyl-CoA ligase (AMP-forming), exosortase A system-associated [Sandaracinobacteroides sayramensis]
MQRLDHLLDRGTLETTALVDRDRSLSYAELKKQVSAVAGSLRALVAPGDRVAVWLPKSLEAVVLMFAIGRAGAIAVPLNPVLRGQQVQHILADSGAALLISHRPRGGMLADSPCPVRLLEDSWAELAAGQPADDGAPGGEALAALLYTSGSTGRPKGVMVTHRNLLVGARSVAAYLGTQADDRVLSVLPLSFDFGFSQLTTAFHAGARAVLLDYLTPRDVVQACLRHEITQLAAVPPLWVQLAALDWPAEAVAAMRTLSNSGGRLPVPTVQALRRLFPDARLHLMYGLTEAFRSTTLPPELADSHPASIGRAIPDAEILVVRADGTPTDDGEAGELVHSGPLVAKGYWRDAERTAQRFRPAPAASKLGGMAVWSGDTVVRDADGLLTFVGRADETIKTMGTRVSPTEIEELAHQSGAVSAAVALGVADALAGQKIRLVATAADGFSEAEAETRLIAHFRREAAPFMQPAAIVWLDAFPVSANGKLDRATIRERFGQ